MSEMAYVAEIAKEIEVPKGIVLFHENEIGDCLYIVVSGQVEVIKTFEHKEKILAVLGEKECVGEMSILDDEPRSATVKTNTNVFLLKITNDDFKELINENPEIAFGVFKMFTGRIRKNQVESETTTVIPSISM